jgi:hypothetical protein
LKVKNNRWRFFEGDIFFLEKNFFLTQLTEFCKLVESRKIIVIFCEVAVILCVTIKQDPFFKETQMFKTFTIGQRALTANRKFLATQIQLLQNHSRARD